MGKEYTRGRFDRVYSIERSSTFTYVLLEKLHASEGSDRGVSHARVLGARVLLRGGFTVLRTPPRIRGGVARAYSTLAACILSAICAFLCVAGVRPTPQSQPCPRSITEVNLP